MEDAATHSVNGLERKHGFGRKGERVDIDSRDEIVWEVKEKCGHTEK